MIDQGIISFLWWCQGLPIYHYNSHSPLGSPLKTTAFFSFLHRVTSGQGVECLPEDASHQVLQYLLLVRETASF